MTTKITVWRREDRNTTPRGFGDPPTYYLDKPQESDMVWAEPIDCILPPGYTVAESESGEHYIYAPDGSHCPIVDRNGHPGIIVGTKYINGESQPHIIRLDVTTLKELIHIRNMTIKGFADKNGINPRTLKSYTSGRRSLRNASADIVSTIAAGLCLSVDDLMDEIGC
jgi:hypothetical protein